jgi:hypothetical protein
MHFTIALEEVKEEVAGEGAGDGVEISLFLSRTI